MTIQQVIDKVDRKKPNYMDRQTKVEHLQDLDQIIYQEILLKHRHTAAEEVEPDYSGDRTGETQLLVPATYGTDMYVYWLECKIDEMNQEIDKLNNDTAMFNTAYETMHDWWRRTRMPLQPQPFVTI